MFILEFLIYLRTIVEIVRHSLFQGPLSVEPLHVGQQLLGNFNLLQLRLTEVPRKVRLQRAPNLPLVDTHELAATHKNPAVNNHRVNVKTSASIQKGVNDIRIGVQVRFVNVVQVNHHHVGAFALLQSSNVRRQRRWPWRR